ncbi:MAG: hydrogenase maturation protease, partial [Planctomycetes bacterium]|nr:hydrogenase maturation protease [Planctomycetota bacterium]
QMRGAKRVVLVDATTSGSEPGALFKVPGEEIADLPPVTDVHSHAFRWDHALAFAKWLLKDEFPETIEVYLIEVAQIDPGAELSDPVRATAERLCERLAEEFGRGELTREAAAG